PPPARQPHRLRPPTRCDQPTKINDRPPAVRAQQYAAASPEPPRLLPFCTTRFAHASCCRCPAVVARPRHLPLFAPCERRFTHTARSATAVDEFTHCWNA